MLLHNSLEESEENREIKVILDYNGLMMFVFDYQKIFPNFLLNSFSSM